MVLNFRLPLGDDKSSCKARVGPDFCHQEPRPQVSDAPCVDGSGLARGLLTFCTLLVGAAMCPAFQCGTERGRWP
jgi:hypothetical protein